MTTETTNLPTLDEMTDLDKGCALLHLWKREWEGASYAVSDYPCVYMDDPRLVALSPREACRHAVKVLESAEAATALLGDEEWQRLYDLALAEPDRRCLWAAANEHTVVPLETEQKARDLLATWAGQDADPPAWYTKLRDPTGYRLLRRGKPGGEWVEVRTDA